MTKLDALSFIDSLIGEEVTSGKIVRSRRLTLGMTQKDLAELADMKTTFISSVENDRRSLGVHGATKLAIALGLHPSSILFPNGVEMSKELKRILRNRERYIKAKAS